MFPTAVGKKFWDPLPTSGMSGSKDKNESVVALISFYKMTET